jgi:hypothetical protein
VVASHDPANLLAAFISEVVNALLRLTKVQPYRNPPPPPPPVDLLDRPDQKCLPLIGKKLSGTGPNEGTPATTKLKIEFIIKTEM